MSSLRILLAAALGCSFAMMGCAGDASHDDGANPYDAGDMDVSLKPAGFEYANGLLPSCFWNHGTQKALRKLALAPLADASGTMPQMPDVAPLCYEAIQYAVQCALGSGDAVTNPHDGATYQGAVGLAPNWRTQSLDNDGKRWVTACMLQRLNALGLEVPILMEGNHPSLYEDPAQDTRYPHEESVAFGDLFSSTELLTGLTPAFTAYVCGEQELTELCLNSSAVLNLRLCDNIGLLCGVKYIGKCSDKCVADGPYWNCPAYGYSQTIRVQTQDALCL